MAAPTLVELRTVLEDARKMIGLAALRQAGTAKIEGDDNLVTLTQAMKDQYKASFNLMLVEIQATAAAWTQIP